MVKRYLSEFKIAMEFAESAENNLKSSLRTSANRIYFALEKAVVSFLVFKIPKNHQRIWELSSELLGEEYYETLRELYDLRMQADYGASSVFAEFNEEIIFKKIQDVKKMLNDVEDKISKEDEN